MSSSRSAASNDYPNWSVVPPPRCHRPTGPLPRKFCGELASWKVPGNAIFSDLYFCDAHKPRDCQPIDFVGVLRRVTISGVVYFAGVSRFKSQAEAEAVERLDAAVRAAGGILDVLGSYSRMGLARPVALRPEANEAGQREG